VAKKVRTPAPPKRPVQAPQKRTTKRQRGSAAPVTPGGRRNLWTIIALLVVVAVAAIGGALYFALRGNSSSSSKTTSTTSQGFQLQLNPAEDASFNTLAGVRKTKAPWAPEYAHLDSRLGPLGLASLSAEQLVYHIHQHLDIYLNGKHVTIPECIGIFGCYANFVYLTQLHTHHTDGIIHVESATPHKYTLGDFFAEWGVFLDKQCVGAYCQGYKWYVNGKRMTGNPQDLVLTPHLVIVIAIGKQPKHIRSTYRWNGL
jgi:hypothetical protein